MMQKYGMIVGVFLIACATENAAAQRIEPRLESLHSQVLALLSHSGAKERAWAAHLVGNFRLDRFVPEMIALLSNPGDGYSSQKELVIQSAFDALIQLDADVPAEDLVPLFDQYPYEVVILLSKSPKRHEELFFRLVSRPMVRDAWWAICNMLVATETPSFAALLLRDLEITLWVNVYETDRSSSCHWERWFRFRDLRVPADFPPTGFYTLDGSQRRSVLVAPGRSPVYQTRHVVNPGEAIRLPQDERKMWLEDSYWRIEYLQQMLTYRNTLGSHYSKSIKWKDAETFEKEVTGEIDKINDSYDVYLSGLPLYHLLTPEEAAGLRPRIIVEVQDARDDRTVPLPRVTGRNVAAIKNLSK